MRLAWTPDRETDQARAFMSLLRLRAGEQWDWCGSPGQGQIWLVDSTTEPPDPGLVHLHGTCGEPPVAFIAHTMAALPQPSWTFFRAPAQPALLQRWLQSRLPADSSESGGPSGEQPWRRGMLRLTRWPNISQYGDEVEIALTCSQLMQAPMSYAELRAMGMPVAALDQMLSDAYADGILICETGSASAQHPPRQTPGGLFRRVLQRFSRGSRP